MKMMTRKKVRDSKRLIKRIKIELTMDQQVNALIRTIQAALDKMMIRLSILVKEAWKELNLTMKFLCSKI